MSGPDPVQERIERLRKWLQHAISRRKNASDKDERQRRKGIVQRMKERLQRLLKARKRQGPKIVLSPGAPHWGGSGDVMNQVVIPFMTKRGLPVGSRKRTPAHNASIGGSPNSDHLTTKTLTDACDFPTFSGEDDARALAKHLGGTWQPNSYNSFYFTQGGVRFKAQILWGSAINHGDHVHVGVSRA